VSVGGGRFAAGGCARRALVATRTVLDVRVGVGVELQDLGWPRLLVDGEERRPRIAKTYELLAFRAAP